MFVAIDIGGTKTRVACARDIAKIDRKIIFETPQDYTAGFAMLVEAVNKVGGEGIKGIAVGAPGVLSRDRRSLVHAPNLPLWNGAALADELEAALNARVTLENDAALVGLGEAVRGAGKDAAIVGYVTISTGVNGVRIVDGAIDRATYGFELGEQFLGCDATAPTLEDLVSGRAVSKRFGAPPASLGKDHPVWEELAQIVAIGLHNVIAHWSPERIVLGGSMMKEVGIPIDRIRVHLGGLRRKNPVLPELTLASLGDFGGLWGGLVRLRAP